MTTPLTITLAQINLHVGDIDKNVNRILEVIQEAKEDDIILFPELTITGYPPEDLLYRHDFIEAAQKGLDRIVAAVGNIHCIVSLPINTDNGLKNAAVVIHNHTIIATYYKRRLPNYGVFDERRYFEPGDLPCVIAVNNTLIGITICEDLWTTDIAAELKKMGAKMILSLNASPYVTTKHESRLETLRNNIAVANFPIFYCNCIGGQDDLVFDGDSMVLDAEANVVVQAPLCKEAIIRVSYDNGTFKALPPYDQASVAVPSKLEAIHDTLVLGVRDYVEKNQFPGVIIGLSGGIDSALTLAIAVEALGPENVTTVMMPTKFTSDISLEDAKCLADRLGVEYHVLPIEPTYHAFLEMLNPVCEALSTSKTAENIQARVRGTTLMALSNHTGKLVLTTGNRSELAVGYATLYGDMAGGFAVLKDLPKTLVFELSRYINRNKEIIPTRTIERQPSAELSENQKDQDTLPPYEILDTIIQLYINEDKSIKEIVQEGYDEATIKKVVHMININEFKRRQAPPGVRIHPKAFGRDRRYPITSGF